MTRARLNAQVRRYGLHVAYYNAGGNPQYKITTGAGYFEASSADTLFRSKRLREVAAWLEGYSWLRCQLDDSEPETTAPREQLEAITFSQALDTALSELS